MKWKNIDHPENEPLCIIFATKAAKISYSYER